VKILRRLLKVGLKFLKGLAVVVVVIAIAVTAVIQTAGSPDFVAPKAAFDATPVDTGHFAHEKAQLADYYRSEEQTVLTLPEWYLVYNPLEYAGFLAGGTNPGDFPFFQSIDEYWSLYDKAVTTAAEYGVDNDDYILMLRVIGISTTVEFMLKGLYEKSVGRFTRWTAGNVDTREDRIIAAAHKAYSDLLVDEVWYVFDFDRWSDKIWRDTSFFGDNFLRKIERKIFFTLEFRFKAFYARLIAEAAAATADGESSGLIYIEAMLPVDRDPSFDGEVTLVAREGRRVLLACPRWGGFTRSLPLLLAAGVVIDNVSGNDRIAVSYLIDQHAAEAVHRGEFLFDSRLVTSADRARQVRLVSFADLADLLAEIDRSGGTLEHIYDY
tara:strand:- start:1799 stop:2944 length:1146 start_codon:yes stop_codon:yes gene_type:complete